MKKILITAAGAGPARAAALGLARAGHQVIATAQVWPQVTELRDHVADEGLAHRVAVEKLDELDERDLRAAVSWDFDTFVSNTFVTGIGPGTAVADSGPLAEIPVELVRRAFETNVFANLELTQRIVRRWIDDGAAGRVIVVSSTGGLLTTSGYGAHCASKHALEAIAATLRDELAPTGITVQTISTQIVNGPFDQQPMIDRMVEIIGADDGNYRNVWPPAVETRVKKAQEAAWTLPV